MSDLVKGEVNLSNGQQFVVQGDRILIECEQDSDTFGDSGIIKAEKYKKYARSGWIRQIGDIVTDEFKVGDKVFFEAYTGVDLDLNGKEHKLVTIDNILCKVEDDDESTD